MNPIESLKTLFKPDVARLVQKKDVDGLINALQFGIRVKNDDAAFKVYKIREQAAQALGQLGDTRAVEPLVQYLQEESYSGTAVLSGMKSLLILDPEKAKVCFPSLLKHKYDTIRKNAAESLGKIKASIAVEQLIGALNDEHPSVRDAAGEALGIISDERAIAPLVSAQMLYGQSGYNRAFAGALVKFGDKSIPHLVSGLKNPSFYQRRNAVSVLRELKWQPETEEERINYHVACEDFAALAVMGGKGVDAMFELMANQKENVDIRMSVIKAIARVADDRRLPALMEALKDKELGVQNHAAMALGDIGDKKAVAPLIEVMSTAKDTSGTGGVIKFAADALGRLSDPAAVDALIKALEHKTSYVREAAATALGKIGDKRAVEPLKLLLDDKYSTVVGAAEMALDKLGGKSRWKQMLESIQKLSLKTPEQIENLKKECVQCDCFSAPSEVVAEIKKEYESYTRIARADETSGIFAVVLDNYVRIGNETAPPTKEMSIRVARAEDKYYVFYKGTFLR